VDRVLGLLTLLFALLARHSLLVLAVRLVERELDGFEVVPDLLMDVPEISPTPGHNLYPSE
jgi:hypothetical protein